MSFRGKFLRGSALLVTALLAAACAGDYPQSVFRPVTDFAGDLNDLFMMIFWWTIGILVLVELALLFIVFKFRHRPGSAKPKPVHGNTTLEIIWTLIPALIIVIIAVPTVRQIFASYRPAPEGALVIEAVGHQWWWEFRYPEYEMATANEMHVPVGRPVEIRLSSADVIHNFWFPRLAGKRYNYPIPAKHEGEKPGGHEIFNILSFTVEEAGDYLGQCAEYCGTSHAIMRMKAVAHEADDFDAWVASMKSPAEATTAGAAAGVPGVETPAAEAPAGAQAVTPEAPVDPLLLQGRQLFVTRACVACHAVQGTNARGIIGPNLTRVGARWTIGAGALPMSRENLVAWIKTPSEFKPGVLMPGTQEGAGGMPPTGLSDEEVEAIAAYLFSLK